MEREPVEIQRGAGPQAIGGRFVPYERFPGGGVSTWMASDAQTGQRVLLRLLPVDTVPPSSRRRLESEIEELRRLDARTLAPPVACGVEGDLFYVAVHAPEGKSLAKRLETRLLSLPETLRVAQAVLEALGAMHARGILHREVTPALVVAQPGPPVQGIRLVDFGLSRTDTPEPLILPDELATVRHLSPEQLGLLERPLGPPSDLYSLGTMLFECLTGRPAFDGERLSDVFRQHLTHRVALKHSGVRVPRAFEDMLQRLLEKDPDGRYQSAAAVLADIQALQAALERGETEPVITVGGSDRRATLTEPTFIGRVRELEELTRQLTHAIEGAGVLVLLEAESGGGKSRMLEEITLRAEERNCWVLRGGVDPSSQAPLTFLDGVLESILARAGREDDFRQRLKTRLTPWAHTLCNALPKLRGVLEPSADEAMGPEAFGEHRTVRALTELLSSLSTAQTPFVLLLDDFQWADELAQKLFLHWSTPGVAAPHSYVVVAFRSEEVGPSHTLRSLHPSTHVVLSPLGPELIRELGASMAGALPAEVTDAMVRGSGGNPFMASAILRGLVEEGALEPGASGWRLRDETPQSLHSSREAAGLLVQRLSFLPDSTRRLLSLGAVLGRDFDAERVAALAGVDVASAVDALAEATRRNLLWSAEGARQYTFVHDKIRETVLGLLSGEEARGLHRLAGEELEKRDPSADFQLAYHFDAAGEYRRALPFALSAAQQARSQHALETAERYYNIAERGAKEDPQAHFEVVEGLGDVLMLRGRYAEAEQRLRAALDLCRTNEERARTQGKLGELAFKQGDVEEAIRSTQAGLRLLGRRVPQSAFALYLHVAFEVVIQLLHTLFPRVFLARRPVEGAGPELLAVRLFSRLAYAYWFARGRVACLWAQLRDMNLAERYPPTPELAQAYSEHSPAMTLVSYFKRALRYADMSLAMRRAQGDVWGQGQSLNFYGVTLYAASRFSECIRVCEEAVRLLERTGDAWEANLAREHIALSLYRTGNLAGAVEAARRVRQLGMELNDPTAVRIATEVWSKATGGHIPRELTAAELSKPVGDPQTYVELLQAEAVRLLAEGDTDAAIATLERARDTVRRASLVQEYILGVEAWLATALRKKAEQSSALAPRERRRILRYAQTVAAEAIRISRRRRNNLAHALREAGLLAAMQAQPGAARRRLEQSLRVATELGMQHERALTRVAMAELDVAHGLPGAREQLERVRHELAAIEEPARPEVVRAGRVTISLAERFPNVLEAGRTLATRLTREAIFEAARQAVLTLLRAETCTIVEVAQPRSPPLSPGITAGLLEVVSALRQAVVPPDGALEGNGERRAGRHRSLLCAPIYKRGQWVAYLVATHKHLSHLFGEEEKHLANFITTLAGAALENAEGFSRVAALSEERGRLYEEAQEALRLRDDFISIAAHELKTPLTSLQLNLQSAVARLQKDAGSASGALQVPEWLPRKITNANAQVGRLTKLVNELLDLRELGERRLTLRVEQMDLTRLAQSVLERQAQALMQAGCTVSFETRGDTTGRWDGSRLEQVISNLLSNALKYGRGKPVAMSVIGDPEDRVQLTVRDEGIGIPAEDQPRIFDRFERAVPLQHYGGFGLGLWIARQIVDAHGGCIRVESAPGQGASFIVTLPRSSGTEEPRLDCPPEM